MNFLKSAITLFFTTLIGLTGIQAQSENSEFGLKGGVNFSNFYSNEIDDQDVRIGFQGGLFFKAALNHFLAIQPEILYTQKGSTVRYDNFLSGEAAFTNTLNYLEIPVMGVFNITESFNLHAGPYFAYLIKAGIENDGDNNNFNFTKDLEASDFERIDYGVGIGAGFEYETVRFGARYNYGMTEIGKEYSFTLNGSAITSDQFKDLKNATLSIYLGISL